MVQKKDPSDWDLGPQMEAACPWTVLSTGTCRERAGRDEHRTLAGPEQPPEARLVNEIDLSPVLKTDLQCRLYSVRRLRTTD